MAYTFLHVDRRASDLSSSAEKYRALRLEALQQSPTAFSSTWEIESRFTNDVWVSRLRDPNKETFACIYEENGTSDWVAQVTLRGPIPAEYFVLPVESGQHSVPSDENGEKWQMLSLYTSISHRGNGLGAQLCQQAFQFLAGRMEGTDLSNVTVRIMVKPENAVTIRLYEGLGFKKTGLCTLEEALKANGDEDAIPQGELDEKYTARTGFIMALQLPKRG